MHLKKLIQNIEGVEIKGAKDIEITGLCNNSKLVSPGNLFIAKKGAQADGTRFIREAIAAGAIAILTDLYDPFLQVTQLIHPEVAKIEAKLASIYYAAPAQELKVVGVTGTNGKTTSSFLIRHLLEKNGVPCGLIGTIEWIVGQNRFPGLMTTPDVLTLHKLLREMVGCGCRAAVMEVSSHGLEQNRVGEIDFEVGLFTNLTQDHLDYHGDMESYRKAKEKLFVGLGKDKRAIFNADEAVSFQTGAHVLTYGIEKVADVEAHDLLLTDKKSEFTVSYREEKIPFKSSLIGKFNVYNLLGSIAVGIALGFTLEQCLSALKSFKQVPGRLEKVKNPLDLHIFVDYAHTEDALKNVLQTLKDVSTGKLITVFGCGGDRDRTKRAKMGRVVSLFADEAIITSDNPRSEDPQTIVDEILRGIPAGFSAQVELDRRRAIQLAIERMGGKDILLIAGKGHERQQIFSTQVVAFDDVSVAQEMCEKRALIGL